MFRDQAFFRVFRGLAAAFFSGTFFMLWRNASMKSITGPGLAAGCGAAVISWAGKFS
jgi:hypothetical protein